MVGCTPSLRLDFVHLLHSFLSFGQDWVKCVFFFPHYTPSPRSVKKAFYPHFPYINLSLQMEGWSLIVLGRKENYCVSWTYILDFPGKGEHCKIWWIKTDTKIDKDRTACFYILPNSLCLNEFAYNLSSNADIYLLGCIIVLAFSRVQFIFCIQANTSTYYEHYCLW